MKIAVVVIGLAMIGITGCVSTEPGPEAETLALAPQSSERYQCGPSTLASVLAFHGASVDEEKIADAIYSPTARGVLIHDMAWYARDLGFDAKLQTGKIEDLKSYVDKGQPPIVLLDLGVFGIRQPHFTAITGWTENGLHQLGMRRANEYVSMRLFTRQWERAGNQYLVITP